MNRLTLGDRFKKVIKLLPDRDRTVVFLMKQAGEGVKFGSVIAGRLAKMDSDTFARRRKLLMEYFAYLEQLHKRWDNVILKLHRAVSPRLMARALDYIEVPIVPAYKFGKLWGISSTTVRTWTRDLRARLIRSGDDELKWVSGQLRILSFGQKKNRRI